MQRIIEFQKRNKKSALRAQLEKKIKYAAREIRGNKVKACQFSPDTRDDKMRVHLNIWAHVYWGLGWGYFARQGGFISRFECDCGTILRIRREFAKKRNKNEDVFVEFLPAHQKPFYKWVQAYESECSRLRQKEKGGEKRTKQERPRQLHRQEKANQGEESFVSVGEETWKW